MCSSWFIFKAIHAGRMNSEAWVVSRKYIVGFNLLVKIKRFCAVYANISIPRSQAQYKFKYNNLPVENSPL